MTAEFVLPAVTLDLKNLSSHQLLRLYSGVLSELIRRKVIRTLNAPVGDLAETLVSHAFMGELAPNSEKSWDVRDVDRRLLQVKSRVIPAENLTKPIQFSIFRSWSFDAAIFVVFAAEDYEVVAAIEVPAASVEEKATTSAWVGGWRFTTSLGVLKSLPGAIDRTDLVQASLENLDTTAAITQQGAPLQ